MRGAAPLEGTRVTATSRYSQALCAKDRGGIRTRGASAWIRLGLPRRLIRLLEALL